MNTRNKGNRIQLKISKLLQPYFYVHMNGHKRFGQWNNYNNKMSQDIYGLWDGILLEKQGCGVFFIQISTNKFHTFGQYQKFCRETKQNAYLFCWMDRKGFKAKFIDANGNIEEFDINKRRFHC